MLSSMYIPFSDNYGPTQREIFLSDLSLQCTNKLLLRVVYRLVFILMPKLALADGMRQLAACLPNVVVHPLSVTYKHGLSFYV